MWLGIGDRPALNDITATFDADNIGEFSQSCTLSASDDSDADEQSDSTGALAHLYSLGKEDSNRGKKNTYIIILEPLYFIHR